MKEVPIKVFTYEELDEKAQNRVVNDAIGCLIEFTPLEQASPAFKKAYDEAERMQTPWFLGEMLWDYAKDEIMEFIHQSEYYSNGRVHGPVTE